jgi:hypothetical protein
MGLFVLPEIGCGGKSDSTSDNPDMGTVKIPPGRKAGEGNMSKDVKKK